MGTKAVSGSLASLKLCLAPVLHNTSVTVLRDALKHVLLCMGNYVLSFLLFILLLQNCQN